jgi:ribose/xylose/arabinose/galactoside ABC-type transport system permease subunit
MLTYTPHRLITTSGYFHLNSLERSQVMLKVKARKSLRYALSLVVPPRNGKLLVKRRRKAMGLNTMRFLSLLFTALALAPSLGHLLELPNKINLSAEDYLTVQQIYRGWALLGIVVFGALLSTLVLTIIVRKKRRAFILTLIAFLCIVGTQVVFWTFTYPANEATNNWTVLPGNWLELRNQWEYSHATGAGLNLIALITLILSVLVSEE